MDFSFAYLGQRFFYRVVDFFHHWYVDGSKNLLHRFMGVIESVDQVLAIGITLRYFGQPLYKDYTVIGRVLGVIFRSFRILIGLVIYAVLVSVFILIYAAWILIPAVFLFYAVKNF